MHHILTHIPIASMGGALMGAAHAWLVGLVAMLHRGHEASVVTRVERLVAFCSRAQIYTESSAWTR